jgi:hypothetical protein
MFADSLRNLRRRLKKLWWLHRIAALVTLWPSSVRISSRGSNVENIPIAAPQVRLVMIMGDDMWYLWRAKKVVVDVSDQRSELIAGTRKRKKEERAARSEQVDRWLGAFAEWQMTDCYCCWWWWWCTQSGLARSAEDKAKKVVLFI